MRAQEEKRESGGLFNRSKKEGPFLLLPFFPPSSSFSPLAPRWSSILQARGRKRFGKKKKELRLFLSLSSVAWKPWVRKQAECVQPASVAVWRQQLQCACANRRNLNDKFANSNSYRFFKRKCLKFWQTLVEVTSSFCRKIRLLQEATPTQNSVLPSNNNRGWK